MPDAIQCPSCEKTFRWSRQIAGRRVKCACGQKFTVPDDPDGAVIPAAMPAPPKPQLQTFELSEPDDTPAPPPTRQAGGTLLENPGQCPSCNGKIADGAVVCILCGYNLAAGGRIDTRVETAPQEPEQSDADPDASASVDALTAYGTSAAARALAERQDERQVSAFRETVAPIVLLIVGVLFILGYSYYDTETLGEAGLHLLQNAGIALVSTMATVGGVLVIAGRMGVYFGPFRTVMLKCLALGLFGSFPADAATVGVMPILIEMLGVHGLIGVISMCVTLNVVLVGGPAAMIFDLDRYEWGFLTMAIVVFKLVGLVIFLVFVGSLFTA